MDFKEFTKIIKENKSQYSKIDDKKLYNSIVIKIFNVLFSIPNFIEKTLSFFTNIKDDSKSVVKNTDAIIDSLKEIEKNLIGTQYEKHFSDLVNKLDNNNSKQLSEIIELLEEIKNKKPIEKTFYGGGTNVDTSGIEAKLANVIIALNDIRDNTADIEINADTINLNTDEIETKLDTINTNLQSLISSSAYKLSDIDDTTATEYYGYLLADGNWYIMKVTATAARYCKGTSNYATAWTGRIGLSYDYYDVIF